MIAERINQIGTSPTLKIAAKAKALKAEGIDVIDLSVGEPDFPTFENAKTAAKKAIDANQTKYTTNEGIPELRQSIVSRLKDDHGLEYATSQIIVSNGAKHSLYNAVMAMVNEDEEVIIPSPFWVSYPEIVKLAKGKPVYVQTKEENGFRVTPDELRNHISASTKLVILNNPCNPTGAGYTREELEALAEVIVDESIYCVSDEIYKKLVYDDFRFYSLPSLGTEIKNKTVLIDGVSKAYSMTGWRIGFAAGPKDIIEGMAKVQSHSTSNPSSISQYAALEALKGPQYEISRMLAEFQKRRNYVMYKLQSIAGVSCVNPRGAFYVFPNVSSYYEKEFDGVPIRNSYGMAYYLLKHANVAIVPGDAFGTDDFIRISYATSMENLEKGMTRIIDALGKLKSAPKKKIIALNNTKTHIKKNAAIESEVSPDRRDALVAEAEAHLTYNNYFEWNANINGVVIQLRTNVGHLYDFWVENWYPAQLEADIEPHGIIYAVDQVTGREPHVFYNSDTKTGVLFNTDHYGSLRSLALGMVTDIAERLFDMHAVRGMSLDINGNGILLIGPTGTKKTELFFTLLQEDGAAFHSPDLLFIRYGGGYAAADVPERKVYIPTSTVESFDLLASLFDKSKCENVATRKDECDNPKCLGDDSCRLDRGAPYCYEGSKKAYAMLDPYWIGGMSKHVKRIDIRHIFIMKKDSISPIITKLDEDDAIHILETGFTGGVSSGISSKNDPFYNPHLLVRSTDRLELHKRFYRRLLHAASCYHVNTGIGSLDEVKKIVMEVIEK